MANAENRTDEGVATGLGQYAGLRIDQDDGDVRGRCSGGHVARVLFVPRRVGDDELAVIRCEEPVGHINGDALLPFRSEAIDEQGKTNVAALGAMAFGVVGQRRNLILKNQLRLVEHAAN